MDAIVYVLDKFGILQLLQVYIGAMLVIAVVFYFIKR